MTHSRLPEGDALSPAQRSALMARIGPKDSKPEMSVRRLFHQFGYRYRLHRRDLPGTPDIVFPSRRKVVFVHGCFWHRHPRPDRNSGNASFMTTSNVMLGKSGS